jgi:valyl-tRNA synthetase
VAAIVQAPRAETRETLEKWKGYLMPLAGLSSVTIGSPGPKPAQAAAFVGEQMEIFVPLAGLINFDEERARVKKEIARAEGELGGISKKLENPNFVQRAPADVVEKDRARVEELKGRISKLNDHLKRLGPEAAMPDQKKPTNGSSAVPQVSSIMETPEAAKVHIAPPANEGDVDLTAELEGELKGVKIPEPVDPQVKEALAKLREGTKEGLSSSDHYDLGVAYMGMGLVDDAVREFNEAKKGEGKKASTKSKAKVKAKAKAKPAAKKPKAKAKAAPKKKVAAKSKSKAKAKPAKKAKRKK